MAHLIKINARRLFCPMPVIKMQDEVEKHAAGTQIEITCSDPGALNDIPAWARIHGHTMKSAEKIDGEYVLVVEVV
jgi:tRNA 2-thiouridine synthesizing protein A